MKTVWPGVEVTKNVGMIPKRPVSSTVTPKRIHSPGVVRILNSSARRVRITRGHPRPEARPGAARPGSVAIPEAAAGAARSLDFPAGPGGRCPLAAGGRRCRRTPVGGGAHGPGEPGWAP